MEDVKRYLEKAGGSISEEQEEEGSPTPTAIADSISRRRHRFFERFVLTGLRVDLIEPGRILCSFKVPPRLLNAGNFLHGGATATLVDLLGSAAIFTVGSPVTGVSVEINISYLDAAYVDEEIEVEAKVLRVGKAVGVATVELRKKSTGKVIAQGRQTKYLNVASKL
ncbi:acyl-coenzyme A thioesterase 13 [Punica granatum]|uniref:Acyl-coenzyme A thioesterase 13 n=2 Tax=Punica granatum TaxID=22663 RepID=A0A6P8E6S2_PUNGR|nr:acyl-coenzyme A thioesterase 13 [Punica granatum]PKI39729.1 hypothetical protein CRG98_039899 [Punica granatum]